MPKKTSRILLQDISHQIFDDNLRKSKNYTVDFQDVEKTNILLKKAGVYDKLDQTTKDEVAKILGVEQL